MFSDERKNSHIHTQTYVYIYKKKREKELSVNLKPQNFPSYTLTHTKKAVSETQNHSNFNTQTHNYKHIKYQRRVKQTKINTLQERGTTTPI